jgi:Autographiviridae endonuclease VII
MPTLLNKVAKAKAKITPQRQAYEKAYRAANREGRSAVMAAWYQKNREHVLEYSRKWKSENRDRVDDAHFRRTYGITLTDYRQMYAAQGGLCAICEQPFERLHVDHNHETTVVRALLCISCNRGIGFLKTPERLNRAAQYVDNHE